MRYTLNNTHYIPMQFLSPLEAMGKRIRGGQQVAHSLRHLTLAL
jgi:hypothetical protein